MATLADYIAASVRIPTITLYLNGRRVLRVLRARVSHAYGSGGVAGGTVVLRDPPREPTEGDPIRWSWGYNSLEVPGFTGYVSKVIDNSYPSTWELEVQDVLWLAQREQRPIAVSPLNNVSATDAITYILNTYAGITRIDLPDIKINGSTWTLGQLTPISWDKTTALAACQQIAGGAGYWLYADAGGTVTAELIERRPSDSPFRTFRRGESLLVQGAPQRIRDGSQVRNRITVRGANTGVQGAQLYDTYQATHALYPGVVSELEYSNSLLEYIADVTACTERLAGLWNRKPTSIPARIKADPRLRVSVTVAIEDEGVGLASAKPYFIYSLDTEFDGAIGKFDQQMVLDGGTGSAGYTTIPNPVAVIAVRVLERETVDGTAITVFEVDGSASYSRSAGEIVSYAWTLADTPYSGTASSATTAKATFIVADTEAPFSVTLTVTDTTSKTGTATTDIPLSGDVVESSREAVHAAGGSAWSYTPDGGATWRDDVRTTTIVAEGAGVWDSAPAADAGTYGALATSSAQVRQTLDGLASASTLLSTAGGTITALHVNARDASRVWRAVGTTLQRSLDGGTTWATVSTAPASVRDIIEDPALDNSVFILAGANAYNSTDGGVSGWATLYAGPSGATARWFVRSDDGGTTWIAYTGTFTGSPLQRIEGGISATGITGECRALALVQTDAGDLQLVAVDAASPPKVWYGPASTGALSAGPTLPSGSTAQHATASRLAPLVYIADFDSVSAGVTGALRKLVLGQSTPALLPWRLGPAGRQYHMVQLASAGAAINAEILLAPWGATGAGDKIWRHVPGAGWQGITPPSAGKYWSYITASPFTPSSWLLMGNSTATNPERMAVDAGGIVRMADGSTHPLWYTEDNGATWTAVSLTSPTAGPAAASADMALIRVEWLAQSGGWGVVRQKPTATVETTLWRGTGSTAGAPATSSGVTGALALAPGADDDLVAGPSGSGTPKMIYQSSGGTFATPSGSGGIDVAQGDVIPGTRGAVFVGRTNFDLYATSDYRSAQPTLKLTGTFGTLATMADGTVLTPGATGVYRITDPTGSPVATLVAGVGVAWGVLRPDRQTRTQVATRSGATVLVYTGSDWATLAIPSDASDATLGPRLEILTRA